MTQKLTRGEHKSTAAQLLTWIGLILAVVALGLVVRFVVAGPVGDFLGGVLYTVLIAVLVFPLVTALVRLRMPVSPSALRNRHWIAAGVALAVSVAVELLQLSSIPAQLSHAFPPARLVLGTSFAPLDLVAYGAGALLAGTVGSLVVARANARLSATTLSTNSSSSESRGP